ncbi:MAG TPA: hypothetical protein VIL48_01560 [Acidimicrobiales bacterium]
MIRLVGLWTKPSDVDGFREAYLSTHFPLLDRLENALDATVSTCLEGRYFQMTEVSFTNVQDMEAALDTDLGKHVLTSGEQLAKKFGVELEMLVVGEPH